MREDSSVESVLRRHAARYPLMQVSDAVKLLYQNEFGSGHLVKDPQSSLQFLCQEFAAIKHDEEKALCEDIGNGYVRLNLAALHNAMYSLEEVNHMFITTAGAKTGSEANFLRKLKMLRALTEDEIFSFGGQELERYLAEYRELRYPAVSHSEQYRQAYSPAYRVILHSLLGTRDRGQDR